MRDWADGPSLVLHHSAPPYGRLEPLRDWRAADRILSFGSILAAEVRDAARDLPQEAGWISALRSRFPVVPLLVWAPSAAGHTLLDLARRVERFGAGAVLVQQEPTGEAVRAALSRPVALGSHVVDWLVLRGVSLPPTARDLIREIFRAAPQHRRTGTLLRSLGHAERSARYRFHRWGLARPERVGCRSRERLTRCSSYKRIRGAAPRAWRWITGTAGTQG